jgi:predicted AlkP superfamily pyrophosphatase or phosphodiesterase
MRETTIVILIDALGYELAERHRFDIPGLTHRASLRTVLGFSQAAIATILTGLEPSAHSLWMMYSFSPDHSPFAWLRVVPRRVSARRRWFRRLIRWRLRFVSGIRGYYSLYDVPREVLPYLDVPARGNIFERGGGAGRPTILDALGESETRFLVWDYRTPEERAFSELESAVRAGRASFYLLYTAALDGCLHSYGTLDPRVGSRLAVYRERIGCLVSAAPTARVIVLGDHGMCDVRGHLDVMGPVDALGLELGRDFVPFYDATMARFKVFSPRAEQALGDLLRSFPSGRLLDPGEMAGLGVSFPDGRFGDFVFLADAGTIINPSYMGGPGIAAMHGYHPDSPEMSSVLLSNVEIPIGTRSIRHVADFLLPGFGRGRRKAGP